MVHAFRLGLEATAGIIPLMARSPSLYSPVREKKNGKPLLSTSLTSVRTW